jgi:hypothetical protein
VCCITTVEKYPTTLQEQEKSLKDRNRVEKSVGRGHSRKIEIKVGNAADIKSEDQRDSSGYSFDASLGVHAGNKERTELD